MNIEQRYNTSWITDEEFAELWFTREQAQLMYGLDIECEVIKLRKSKMGLRSGDPLDHIKYLEVHDPKSVKLATHLFYDMAMEDLRNKNEV